MGHARPGPRARGASGGRRYRWGGSGAARGQHHHMRRLHPASALAMLVNTRTKGSIPVVTHCDDATPVMSYDALTLACERRADASIGALPPSDVRDRIVAAVAHGHARARTGTGTGTGTGTTGSAPAGAEVAPLWSVMLPIQPHNAVPQRGRQPQLKSGGAAG